MPGQERQSLCCFCVAGLPLHDGGGGGAVPGQGDKAYVASLMQGFHCMMVEGEERWQAKSAKAYVASALQGFHCMMVEGGGVMPCQE
jgi:hypothetical protein